MITNRSFNILVLLCIVCLAFELSILFSIKTKANMLEKKIFNLERSLNRTKDRIELLKIEESVLLNPVQLREIAKNLNWVVDETINSSSYEEFTKRKR